MMYSPGDWTTMVLGFSDPAYAPAILVYTGSKPLILLGIGE
jgi:hypothetical protein